MPSWIDWNPASALLAGAMGALVIVRAIDVVRTRARPLRSRTGSRRSAGV
jgi:hypothetical protein